MTPQPARETHLAHLAQALDLARLSPPKPTNFRVGCVIVSYGPDRPADGGGQILSTGYTLELEGNTHAEQCALTKLARQHGLDDESRLHELDVLAAERNVTLYTTLEPCGLRLSGNKPCVERIIDTRRNGAGVTKVIFGAREPGTFVQDSKSLQRLDEEGVPWEYLPGLEEEILNVAMEGHKKKQEEQEKQGTNVDDITPEEKKRQEALPRNPKKRMMETV
jgi:pyrimidine deaminase RibD-like protein